MMQAQTIQLWKSIWNTRARIRLLDSVKSENIRLNRNQPPSLGFLFSGFWTAHRNRRCSRISAVNYLLNEIIKRNKAKRGKKLTKWLLLESFNFSSRTSWSYRRNLIFFIKVVSWVLLGPDSTILVWTFILRRKKTNTTYNELNRNRETSALYFYEHVIHEMLEIFRLLISSVTFISSV